MAKTRRKFSPEFKREVVALLESNGRPLMQVATFAKLANSGSWGNGSIAGGSVEHLAAAVASGPDVGDYAAET